MSITIQEADLPGHGMNPDELLAKGWVCRDVTWCTAELWALLVSILGDGNYMLLATSIRRPSKDQRGQFIISPAGLANLAAYPGKQ